MGCGSSSTSAAPSSMGGGDIQDEGRIVYDKKTGRGKLQDGGKDVERPEDDFFAVEEATGEQFMAVRPWIGQIEEPENHNPVNNERPDVTYELEYVYGYRCADSKQNVFWNRADQAVYMTAALGVILDPESNQQKFFGGGEVQNTAKNVANDQNHHTDDIMCIDVNKARDTAVTGQVGVKPTIFTWDAVTGQKKNRIKIAKGARGINCVALNSQGWICAADLHNEHQVYAFDEQGNQKFKLKGDTNKIHDCAWDETKSGRFATVGVKHIYFWNANAVDGDKTRGLLSGAEQTSFACCTFDDQGRLWTGGSNGKVYVWGGDDGRTCIKTIDAHTKGFISSIRYTNGYISSGGKDGKLAIIDKNTFEVINHLEIGDLVRAIDENSSQNILVGTRDGTISILPRGSVHDKRAIMSSHSDGEVWGLAQQADGTIVTSGDDNKVMFWDPATRSHKKTVKVTDRRSKAKRGGASTLSKLPDSQCSRAVAVNGDWIAVAGNDGAVSIRASSSPDQEVHVLGDSTEWIECMAFSPDNQYLAVGSHDNKIYVYTTQGFSKIGECTGHNSYIMALDWCNHSRYIRSNCGAYELLFFVIPECQQDPSGRTNTKPVVWATQTVKFQWCTEGIYPSGTDGTHINSVAGSADGQLLATGDDYGLVNLFRDPCRQGGVPRSYRGHSEHVVRVLFGQNDTNLFSIGGYDQTLMQWKRC